MELPLLAGGDRSRDESFWFEVNMFRDTAYQPEALCSYIDNNTDRVTFTDPKRLFGLASLAFALSLAEPVVVTGWTEMKE